MTKIKRFIVYALSLLLLLGSLPVASRAAQGSTLSLSSAEVQAGEETVLTVSVQGELNVAAMKLYLYYDTAAFSVSMDGGVSAQGALRSTGGLLVNSIETARQNGRYDGADGRDGLIVLWYSGSGTDVTADGAVLNIKLVAKDDAPAGSYQIRLDCSSEDCCNEQGQQITLQAAETAVTVQNGSAQTPTKTEPKRDFSDVTGNWAERSIEQAAEQGLVEGYQGAYRPNDTMTRAEFVTILHRAMGAPEPAGKASFTDLTQTWYLDAVAWAEQNGVVNGVGGGRFDPNGNVTREQLVTILYRLAGSPSGMELMLSSVYDSQYPDSGQISSWAKQALYWSIYEQILCGEASEQIGTTLAPKAAVTRAQIAVMVTRYLEKQG